MQSLWTAFIGGLGGAVITAFAAFWQNWVAAGTRIDEGLRATRQDSYKALWALTGAIPKWPRRPELRYRELGALSEAMRDWYFAGGGMYLSRRARAAYGAAQDEIQAALGGGEAEAALGDRHYDAVQEAGSRLRTELTSDLLSRERSTLLSGLRLPG